MNLRKYNMFLFLALLFSLNPIFNFTAGSYGSSHGSSYGSSHASSHAACPDQAVLSNSTPIGDWAVLAKGRVKPLKIHAEEMIRFLTNKKHLPQSPLETYCLWSRSSLDGTPIDEANIKIKVEHEEILKLFENPPADRLISIDQIESKMMEIRAQYAGKKFNDGHKKELSRVLSRSQLINRILSGEDWQVPIKNSDKPQGSQASAAVAPAGTPAGWSWVSLKNITDTTQINWAMIAKQNAEFQSTTDNTVGLESSFYRYRPFDVAALTLILAMAIVLAGRKKIGLTLLGFSLTIETVGIILRVLISGRAPITNMYETVMFSGFGALIIACIAGRVRRETGLILGGMAYNFMCLLMMRFANNMLEPGISPLVPVLRDNFWLSTHVTTVILSYAALALSWILANVTMVRQKLGGISSADVANQNRTTNLSIQIGVTLLSAGIILGGVWADYSWGRFWGWDPKETWSLIVLLIYMAILHGKYAGWITPKNFPPLVAGSFLSVMMAWFGVNYILATGLHSYGFSEGGAIFLGSFFALQIALIAWCTIPLPKLSR